MAMKNPPFIDECPSFKSAFTQNFPASHIWLLEGNLMKVKSWFLNPIKSHYYTDIGYRSWSSLFCLDDFPCFSINSFYIAY
jgi:hypothetical protein